VQEIADQSYQEKFEKVTQAQEQIRLLNMSERDREFMEVQLWHEEQFKLLSEAGESTYTLEQVRLSKLAELKSKYMEEDMQKEQERVNKENAINQARISVVHDHASAVLSAGKAVAGLYKKNGVALKAFAMGEVLVNTSRAVAGALAPPPTGLGPVYGIPLSLLMAVKGGAELATVARQKFAKGGFPSGRNALVQVNEQGQESILNANATSRLGVGAINAINNNTSQAGGITNHISYAPTLTIGDGSSASSLSIMDALEKDKKRFADFFVNNISKKGYLNFA